MSNDKCSNVHATCSARIGRLRIIHWSPYHFRSLEFWKPSMLFQIFPCPIPNPSPFVSFIFEIHWMLFPRSLTGYREKSQLNLDKKWKFSAATINCDKNRTTLLYKRLVTSTVTSSTAIERSTLFEGTIFSVCPETGRGNCYYSYC